MYAHTHIYLLYNRNSRIYVLKNNTKITICKQILSFYLHFENFPYTQE